MFAVIAAKRLGIPTIEQQHGAISKNNFVYRVPQSMRTETKFPLCDMMVVWGPRITRMFVESGVYEKACCIECGSTRVDWMIKERYSRSDALRLLRLPAAARVILYTSNPLATDQLDVILDSIEREAMPEEVHWIVKLHPRERNLQEWREGIHRRGIERVKVYRDEFDLYSLLAASEVHICLASTTILESAIMGVLNLGLSIQNLPDPAGYAEAKGFHPVDTECLAAATYAILDSPKKRVNLLEDQRRFAEDWCIHDGNALERIMNLLNEVGGFGDNPGRGTVRVRKVGDGRCDD
jgi:hypothetical protein